MSTARNLLLIVASTLAFSFAAAAAERLALTYNLDANAHAQRSPISNAGCAGFSWVAGVGACEQREALGRYSRQVHGEEAVSRSFGQGEKPRAASRDANDAIPYLGESDRRVEAPRAQADPEFNIRVGERPRVRRDIEQRFYDAAQEARLNRNLINALGLEVVLPIHSSVRQSADPAVPE